MPEAVELKRKELRPLLLRAAEESVAEGELSRAGFWLIRCASLRRDVLRKVEEQIVAEAIKAKKLSATAAAGSVSWNPEEWLEFIKEILPVILEFIKMLLPLFL